MQHHERDKVRRPCIAYLRHCIAYNQLKRFPFFYWTCPPDIGKQNSAAMGRMKADGYEKGVYDLTIIAGSPAIGVRTWLIEFKWGYNKLTEEQQYTWDKAEGIPHLNKLIIKEPKVFEAFIDTNFK